MKRYELECRYGSGDCLVAAADGDWIRYSDHIEAMNQSHSGSAVLDMRIAGEGRETMALTDEQIKECLGEVRWSNNDAWCIDRIRALLAAPPESRQMVASGEKQKPVATIRVTNNGYSMTLSTYVAYALPEGKHDLYAAPVPSAAPPESRQGVASGEHSGDAWIPVNDRLPEYDGRYLVTVQTDEGPEVHTLELRTGRRSKTAEWWHDGEQTFCHSYFFRPSHWKPLPEAAPPPSGT